VALAMTAADAHGSAAPAFILRHNWAIWPRGEGHAVAVFCVEGPLRGAASRKPRHTDMGLGPISGIEFRKSGQPDRRHRLIGRRQHEEDGNS